MFAILSTSPPGNVTVTFSRYIDHGESLDISLRNRGSTRGAKEVRAANFILGHRVCQSAMKVRTVHDLKDFPRAYLRSPTGSEVKYRSFMIFPVLSPASVEGPQTVIGFVSIDCEMPYAFYGDRATMMTAIIGPMIKQIAQRT